LFQQAEAPDSPKRDDDEEGGVTEGPMADEGEIFFTTNRIYNLFVEERRELMREERDRKVEREIEKDREKRGTGTGGDGLSPSSPKRAPSSARQSPKRTISRGETKELVYEKRKIEFDRVSDMMIQVYPRSLPPSLR
jgi:hypothetical protein